MKKNSLYRMYLFAGGAFMFALIKYFFIKEFSAKFFIVEFLSFSLFLIVVYLFDRYIRGQKHHMFLFEERIKNIREEHKTEIEELKQTIAKLSDKQGGINGDNELKELANRITKGLSGLKDKKEFGQKLLTNLAREYEIGLGLCYLLDKPSQKFVVEATYGLHDEYKPNDFEMGEGLNGQSVVDKECMVVEEVEEDYFNIESCSGSSKPKSIYYLPIVIDNESIGLLELATFNHVGIDKQWELLNNYITDSMSF